MQILSISLKNFMNYKEVSVDLPPFGIVLVTGHNGAGKSTLLEAVSYGLWGKTLRKTTPWQEDLAGKVAIETPDIVVKRTKKSSVTLEWMASGDAKLRKYERTTEAQDELSAKIGTWDTWKRTCVFSSADASNFTLATDAERKHLLEVILGLDKFDPALAACRIDLKLAENKSSSTDKSLELLRVRKEGAQKRLADAQKTLKAISPDTDLYEVNLDDLKNDVVLLQQKITQLENSLRTISKNLQQVSSTVATATANHAHAEKHRLRLGSGNCPECEQPIGEALVKALEEDSKNALDAVTEAKATAEERRAECDDQQTSLTLELKDNRDLLEVAQQKLTTAKAVLRAQEQNADIEKSARGAVQSAEKDIVDIEIKLKAAVTENEKSSKELKLLEAAEVVLGLRGVRAHVLSGTLGGIEDVANIWLGKIAGKDMSLKLNPYKEKAKGGVIDSIDLEIVGAGGGYGYKASSGGERRRIDIALLMALIEVSQAALGSKDQSTLFLDEIFDALDKQGTDAVVTALAELGKLRTVVVISHLPALIAQIKPTLHLAVDHGCISMS